MPSSPVASVHHLHSATEVCPICDQEIPHDRAEEVRRRLEVQAKQQEAEVTARLQERFDREAAEAAERHRLAAEQAVAAARAAALTEAQGQVEAAKAEGKVASDALAATQSELEQVRTDAAAAVERARLEATEAAKAVAADKIRLAHEQAHVLQTKLDAAVAATADAVAAASAEASQAAAAQVAEAIEARKIAEQLAATTKQELEAAQAHVDERLAEQREALEADKAEALAKRDAQNFAHTQSLQEQLALVQRKLEKKTADELGEGAEIDLFETLKGLFEEDRFKRVKRGQPGVDIIHTVVHNGQVCGKIVYDSKNHKAWLNSFITKLRSDQLAEGAEHAILTALKFPHGAKQLHIQDGVMVANPARVAAVVELLRRHMIQTHALRMSSQQRAEKTATLYDFITSETCAGMFERLEGFSQRLFDIQDAERAAHERVWKQQGETIRGSQKVQAEMRNQIDLIIGTAIPPEAL